MADPLPGQPRLVSSAELPDRPAKKVTTEEKPIPGYVTFNDAPVQVVRNPPYLKEILKASRSLELSE